MNRYSSTQSPIRPARRPAPSRAEGLESRTLFAATANDTYFSSQYALANAGVTDAWTTTTGSAAVVVADIDSGADYTHRDLYANVWINQAEIPAAVRPRLSDTDADGRITFYDLNAAGNRSLMTDVNRNGYIDGGDLISSTAVGGWADRVNGQSNPNDRYTDDIIGWDFAENDNNPYDDGFSNGGHGTHTAGVIGAVGNNGTGISGVAQRVSMQIVRIFTDSGYSASSTRIAEAIRYTADGGARVANASWGGSYGYAGDPWYNAIAYAGTKGMLFVTAAGNDGWNLDSTRYNSYPAEYNLANIIAVGATTQSGGLAYYSDYGATTVDVAAPGSSILSTLPGGRYGYLSGTSMATPVVTGSIALMLSANRTLTAAQIKQRLIAGADKSAALNNRSVSDGEINVNHAIFARAGTGLAGVATTRTAATSGGALTLRSTAYTASFFSTSNGSGTLDDGPTDPRRYRREAVWRV